MTLTADPLEARCLVREAERYLGVVDALRAGGYEPRWTPEWLPAGAAAASSLSQSQRKEER